MSIIVVNQWAADSIENYVVLPQNNRLLEHVKDKVLKSASEWIWGISFSSKYSKVLWGVDQISVRVGGGGGGGIIWGHPYL